MTVTDVQIASQALTLLRADTVTTFSGTQNESVIMTQLYADHIKGLFNLYPWTFATKKALLVASTTPTNEYAYSHIIPTEAMLLWAVFNSSQVGAQPIRDYDIYTASDGRRIYSNYSTLYADYTIDVDETYWPPYFLQFAIHSLAAVVALPVTGNADLAQYYSQIAYGSANANRKGGLFGIATSIDSKQKRNEFVISSPITEARFS
jgi:hypothetical protein